MKNLWFLIGPPGSKWSSFANLITLSIDNIDLSDHTSERYFQHTEFITHEGAYFGPGFGMGEQWHQTEYIKRENILSDISKVWDLNNDKIKLIKSHVLSLHLPLLRSAFPDSKFILVTRPVDRCLRGWAGAGGFEKILYPDYKKYYKNLEVLQQKVSQEHYAIDAYIDQNNLKKVGYNAVEFIREFSIDQSVINTQRFSSLDAHLCSYRDVYFAIEN